MPFLTHAFLLLFAMFVISQAPASADEQCLSCHSDKNQGVVVHTAVSMGCASCHAGVHAGDKPVPKLIAAVPALCYTCHDRTPFTRKNRHQPVADGTCVFCHNPHASGASKLLVRSIPDLCFSCHDKAKMQKTKAHLSAAGGNCTTCHDPHTSENSYVLTQLMEEHCSSCHDEQRSGKHVLARTSPRSDHPVRGRADPMRPGKELSCSSCHNPHTANGQKLNRQDPGAVCLNCHRRIRAGN